MDLLSQEVSKEENITIKQKSYYKRPEPYDPETSRKLLLLEYVAELLDWWDIYIFKRTFFSLLNYSYSRKYVE